MDRVQLLSTVIENRGSSLPFASLVLSLRLLLTTVFAAGF